MNPRHILLTALMLPLTACASAGGGVSVSAPAPSIPSWTTTPPNSKAPTVEELKALFYQAAPRHAGKELVVRYRKGECEGQGKASVNTREFYERCAAGHLVVGGGTLTVTYDSASGKVLKTMRAR